MQNRENRNIRKARYLFQNWEADGHRTILYWWVYSSRFNMAGFLKQQKFEVQTEAYSAEDVVCSFTPRVVMCCTI